MNELTQIVIGFKLYNLNVHSYLVLGISRVKSPNTMLAIEDLNLVSMKILMLREHSLIIELWPI